MKQWILENLNWLVPSIATLFSGGTICSIITLIRTRAFQKAIDAAKEQRYYTVCPHCKKKIYLDKLHFHNPAGQVDDNLNGVPDDQER